TSALDFYTLSLLDALPISPVLVRGSVDGFEEAAVRPHLGADVLVPGLHRLRGGPGTQPSLGNPGRWLLRWTLFSPSSRASHMLRSEEHTSELQSRFDLVCR